MSGNSGAEIGVEVARQHPTWMLGRGTGHIPFRINSLVARLILLPLMFRVLFYHTFTVDTLIGRKLRPKRISQGGLLIRVKPHDLNVVGVQNSLPLLADGRVLDAANIIWCTGYSSGFSWIEIPGFAADEPLHVRGVVEAEPGLYFVGQHFQYAVSSTMIHGVARDAEYVADQIAMRSPIVLQQA